MVEQSANGGNQIRHQIQDIENHNDFQVKRFLNLTQTKRF